MFTMIKRIILVKAKDECYHLKRTMPPPISGWASQTYYALIELLQAIEIYEKEGPA